MASYFQRDLFRVSVQVSPAANLQKLCKNAQHPAEVTDLLQACDSSEAISCVAS
jgi:hypothetical protein